MKKKVFVLGGGLVGSVMALDLASDEAYSVTVADGSKDSLDRLASRSGGMITPRQDVDFASPESITNAAAAHDLVVRAVPGSLGFAMMCAVIKAGRSMSGISFMGEEHVRPIRFKMNGKEVELPALAENRESRFDVPGVNLPEMEGFLTDGLRSIITTIPAASICEKTLRGISSHHWPIRE